MIRNTAIRCVLGLFVLSCTGQVSGGSDGPGAGAGGRTGSGPSSKPGECTPEYVGLRRLNRREYANTVRDLLGANISDLAALPVDSLVGGFDTNAVGLPMTPQLYEQYLNVTELVVEQAFSERASAIVGCTPSTRSFDDACVSGFITSFAKRAYRRPLKDEDKTELAALFTTLAVDAPDTNAALAWTSSAILTSPETLYRPPMVNAENQREGWALATRLSYFLWSSTPDERLIDLAASGELQKSEVLRAEVERMLADPKSRDFSEAFATQWLQLGGFSDHVIDTTAFPDFGAPLLGAMAEETVDLVHRVILDGAPRDLVGTMPSKVTEGLASHYGVDFAPDAAGRTNLGAQRRGLLTQGSMLINTSHSEKTSIPARGMWVMSNLLCVDPPPPPPAGIDTSLGEGEANQTQREIFERHSSDAACAGCHIIMDDLGFGLENYDAVGAFRTHDGEQPIDATGKLPDGRMFDGAVQMADLLADPSDPTLPGCLSEKLLAYAIGRVLTSSDACFATAVSEGADSTSEIIARIVQSDAFQDINTEAQR